MDRQEDAAWQYSRERPYMAGLDDQETPDEALDQLNADERAAFDIVAATCRATDADMHAALKAVNPPYLEIDLAGGFAIEGFGNYGKRLDALQFLLNLIVSHKVKGDVRVLLDCDNYRARRVETLTQLALECAEQVKQRQEECELDALPPHERRIIHNALSSDEGVRTYSEGEEPDRRTIIAPR